MVPYSVVLNSQSLLPDTASVCRDPNHGQVRGGARRVTRKSFEQNENTGGPNCHIGRLP